MDEVPDIKMPATIDDPAALEHIKELAGEWLKTTREAQKAAAEKSAKAKKEKE